MKTRKKSLELIKELLDVLPGGVNSPVRAFSGLGLPPMIVESGKGDTITDVDGYAYIDYNLSWGSLILGHAHPFVCQEVNKQVNKGSSVGISTEVEYLLAKKVQELMPAAEKMRFVSSGTEATMTAIRLARGYTGKSLFIKFNGHYHGHGDAFLVKAGSGVAHHYESASSKGIPEEVIRQTASLPFNDMKTFEAFYDKHHKDIAAVIFEPIAGNMGCVPATEEFIQLIRHKTKMSGAVMIMDEVITGFRLGLKGATGYYNVEPDLICLGKIVGGGYPVAAVAGKKKIIDYLAPLGPVYQGGTLSGNPVAMRAGYEVLCELEKPNFYENLQKKTDLLLTPLEIACKNMSFPVCLQHVGPMFAFYFGISKATCFEDLAEMNKSLFNRFFITLFEKGIYISPSPYEASFISMAHTEKHLIYTRDCILEFLAKIDHEIKTGKLSEEYVTSS